MAAGDIIFFDQLLVDALEGKHDLENDNIKLGFTIGTTTPTASTAVPTWGPAGTTDFSAEEVTPGGNYPAGGPSALEPSVNLIGGVAVFNAENILVAQDPSNPTNARWGILYNSTAPDKNAIAAIDFGVARDLTAGALSNNWSASGIGAFNQA